MRSPKLSFRAAGSSSGLVPGGTFKAHSCSREDSDITHTTMHRASSWFPTLVPFTDHPTTQRAASRRTLSDSPLECSSRRFTTSPGPRGRHFFRSCTLTCFKAAHPDDDRDNDRDNKERSDLLPDGRESRESDFARKDTEVSAVRWRSHAASRLRTGGSYKLGLQRGDGEAARPHRLRTCHCGLYHPDADLWHHSIVPGGVRKICGEDQFPGRSGCRLRYVASALMDGWNCHRPSVVYFRASADGVSEPARSGPDLSAGAGSGFLHSARSASRIHSGSTRLRSALHQFHAGGTGPAGRSIPFDRGGIGSKRSGSGQRTGRNRL